MSSDDYLATLEQFLLGTLPFDSAAHALSRIDDTHFSRVRVAEAASPDVRSRAEQVDALLARAAAIRAATQP